ncbi:MAG: hypothetical protein IH623_30735 [Verrucomicrobia bacterium]|nr:hypothetical protein [Verrucomicrobiota bacterium]
MADADKSLNIELRILTKEVGPQKAAEIVKKLREETKQSNVVNREAGNVLAKTRAEMDSSVRSAIKSRDITSQLTLSKQNLKKALEGVTRAIPGASLLRSFLNPVTAGFTLLTLAVANWIGRMVAARNASRALEEAGRSDSAQLNTQVDQLDANIESTRTFNRELSELEEKQKGIKDQTDAATNALSRQHAMLITEMDAQSGAKLAEIDAAVATGQMTPAAAAAARAKVASSTQTAKDEESAKLERKILEEKKKELAALEALRPSLEAEAEARSKTVKQLTDDLAYSEKRAQELSQQIESRNQWMQTHGRGASHAERESNRLDTTRLIGELAAVQTQGWAARTGLSDATPGLESARGKLRENITQGRAASDAIARQQTLIQENSAHRGALAGARNRQQIAEMINRTANYKASDIRLTTDDPDGKTGGRFGKQMDEEAEAARALGLRRNVGLLSSAAAGADAINAGGRADSEQAQAINAAARALGLSGMAQDKVLEILGKMNDREEYFIRALERFESRLNTTGNVE